MGKGRAPCCDKTKVKRGQWSYDEDLKLISFINKYGHENWRSLPEQAGNVSDHKALVFLKLFVIFWWSKIASKLPGRTDKVIKKCVVDKPELLEMPFDVDPDIWSFVNGSDSFQQPENSLTPRAHQDSQEDEVDKWFNHLESELGL
uniref:Myb-like domain-containing protein n=1 Tax=Brassica oleracea var. oleracea TaxID=109376 RepID=A0A0D3CAS5_BRAOL